MSRSRMQERHEITRKKQRQRAPPPLPTRFTRTGVASVVVTASVSDLCTLVTFMFCLVLLLQDI